jgi:outer membrane immunogenic protein
MKKSLLSATAFALAVSAGTALAADLPTHKAPPYIPPPPPPLWTGFYVGLNAGGTFGGSDTTTVSGGPVAVFNNSAASYNSTVAVGSIANGSVPVSNGGFIGGGQVGYNFQTNNLVWGIEADIQGLAGSSNSSSVSGVYPVAASLDNWNGTIRATKSIDYLGTVRGRLGFLFTPTLLVYGTGGLAYGGANASANFLATDTLFASQAVITGSTYSDTLVGWTAGAGLEWMFAPHWSAKVEYLYYDLGRLSGQPGLAGVSTAAGAAYGAIAAQNNVSFNGHIVRAGLNYHFNWAAPAPVVAKY